MTNDLSYKEANIQVNDIKVLYMKTRGGAIPTRTELNLRNVTDFFWRGINGAIKHKELLNIAIRGKTGSSKSTIGIKILYIAIMKMMQLGTIKTMGEKELDEYLFTRINSDQTEFLRFAMKQKEITGTLIDEFSSLGETGFNATTEQAMYSEHSDLFAQDVIKVKISCSPSRIHDKNADIILDIIGTDEENKVTRAMLGYRDATEYIVYPLGIINVYVGDVMKMPFYQRYRKKKFARLDLLKKHGIRNVKELEFARITMGAYNTLRDAAKISKMTQEDILGVVDAVRRQNKMQYSIITLNFVVMQVKSMLDSENKIRKLEIMKMKAKTQEEVDLAEIGIKAFKKILEEKKNEELKKIRIEKEYGEIK